MHALLTAAQIEAERAFDWGGLAVPVVAGSAAIVVAIYNTRGETAALRRLKAMNDVIEKLPEGSEVTATFIAARNRLAQRFALRMNDTRTVLGKFPTSLLFLIGTGIGVAAFVVAFHFAPPVISGFELAANVGSASILFGLLVTVTVRSLAIGAELRRAERELAHAKATLRRHE